MTISQRRELRRLIKDGRFSNRAPRRFEPMTLRDFIEHPVTLIIGYAIAIALWWSSFKGFIQ